jgi:hypothetical protein
MLIEEQQLLPQATASRLGVPEQDTQTHPLQIGYTSGGPQTSRGLNNHQAGPGWRK